VNISHQSSLRNLAPSECSATRVRNRKPSISLRHDRAVKTRRAEQIVLVHSTTTEVEAPAWFFAVGYSLRVRPRPMPYDRRYKLRSDHLQNQHHYCYSQRYERSPQLVPESRSCGLPRRHWRLGQFAEIFLKPLSTPGPRADILLHTVTCGLKLDLRCTLGYGAPSSLVGTGCPKLETPFSGLMHPALPRGSLWASAAPCVRSGI
jgi:hypothetical protein